MKNLSGYPVSGPRSEPVVSRIISMTDYALSRDVRFDRFWGATHNKKETGSPRRQVRDRLSSRLHSPQDTELARLYTDGCFGNGVSGSWMALPARP
jgi:hypothetical protein